MADIISPIDHGVAFTYHELSEAEAFARLDAAETAQRAWADVPLDDRVALCRSMLDAYRAKLDEHAVAITKMMGKPVGQARGEFEGGVVELGHRLAAVDALGQNIGIVERRPDRLPVSRYAIFPRLLHCLPL